MGCTAVITRKAANNTNSHAKSKSKSKTNDYVAGVQLCINDMIIRISL